MRWLKEERSRQRFLVWCVLFFLLLYSPCLAVDSIADIEQIKIRDMPAGWTVTSEFSVNETKVERFERRFAAPINAIYNQLIAVDDELQSRLQVNYVLCPSARDAMFVLRQMVEMVGQRNIVLRKDNVVIEIIATNNKLKKEVVMMVDVSDLQKRKLTNQTLPETWKFVREIAMNEEELDTFSQTMMVNVDEVVNQFFLVDRDRVQLNYIGCKSEKDAKQVYNRLNELTGKVNKIVRKDVLVFEIISTTPKARDEIIKRIEKI